MKYVIETRKPETEDAPAGPWHSDGLSGREGEIDGIEVDSKEEGEEIIKNLRKVGPDWNAEYRLRPL